MSHEATSESWKVRLYREFKGYWLIVAYFSLVFAAFLQYRRFVLASQSIEYENYFFAVIKAMVLAKVVMVGDALRLARGTEKHPMIYATMHKAVVFTVFLVVFTVVEHGVKGAWKGAGFVDGVKKLVHDGRYEALAGSLVIAVSLIPFFAFREISASMPRGRLMRMFFVNREG